MEMALQLLHDFAKRGPQSPTDQDAWQQLYAFTLDVHRRGVKMKSRMVREYLISHGCSLQKASWLSGQYQHFMELLSLYDHQKGDPH